MLANYSKYIVFDVEVMHSDLKIYMLKDGKNSIIDVHNLEEFMKIVDIITDTENIEYKFVGDYCTGFDIPLLIMIKNLYNQYKDELPTEKIVNVIIDFASDKTKKLIKYGCHNTSEEFELIKNKLIFVDKFIDVKFVLGSRLQNTSLKHFQGSILNSVFDFDFDQNEYDKDKLDEYGLNDIETSNIRFKHDYTQSIIEDLQTLSKRSGVYMVNFVPNQIILNLIKSLNISYKKQHNKKQYSTISDLNISYPRDPTISIIIYNILSKLNESNKNKIVFNYLNYSVNIEQFIFSIYNTRFKSMKFMHNITKVNISELILINIIKNLKEQDSDIAKLFYWILKHRIYEYNVIYNKLIKSIYNIINNSSDFKIIDQVLLKTTNFILELITHLYNNNYEILGLVENYMYINTNDVNSLEKIFNSFDKDIRYFFNNTDAYIYDGESVIDSSGFQTGLFDINTRTFDKNIYLPSVASTKKFINNLLGNEKYQIYESDYLFVVGPCVLGLESINKRATVLVYGDRSLLINKNCDNTKLKSRYQLYDKNINIKDLKNYYNEEYNRYFK